MSKVEAELLDLKTLLYRLENERPKGVPKVRDLEDTKANKATDGQVLAYEQATGLWKPVTPAGGATPHVLWADKFTAQTPPAATVTPLTFQDLYQMGDGRYTKPSPTIIRTSVSGTYAISGHLELTSGVSGNGVVIRITRNGGTVASDERNYGLIFNTERSIQYVTAGNDISMHIQVVSAGPQVALAALYMEFVSADALV